MATKRNPEILEKIAAMQEQMRKLVDEFRASEDAAAVPSAPALKERLDTDLIARVRRLVTERPMFFTELVSETGEKENTLKAVLTRMQRDDEMLVNIGQANKALWYLFTPKVAARVVSRLTELGVRASEQTHA